MAVLLSVVLVCLMVSCTYVGAEIEASVLQAQENEIMTALDSYVAARHKKTNLLRSRLEDLRRLHAASLAATHHNPITSFSLVKRLHSYWPRIGAEIDSPTVALPVDKLRRRDVLTAATDALVDIVADTLIRLKATYHLDASSLARGELQGLRCSEELAADDCFDLGRRSFLAGDFHAAAEWMGEALARHDQHTLLTVTEILAYLAHSQYEQGDVIEAERLTREILTLEPDHQSAHNLRKLLETPDSAQAQERRTELPRHKAAYKSLCRGEIKLDEATKATLRCRYADKGSWFLRLARLKEEDAFLSPSILVYHDVISPKEIELVTAVARSRLKYASVLKRVGPVAVETTRLARNCWLHDKELPVVETLSRRAGQMTGLDPSSSERLQVGQYGSGGQCEPHLDHVRDDLVEKAFGDFGTGNRIATVLYYLNDVALGGATVFPELKVSLLPAKGAAVVWFNLHQDGGGDKRTRHAGCPVLAGNKWGLWSPAFGAMKQIGPFSDDGRC